MRQALASVVERKTDPALHEEQFCTWVLCEFGVNWPLGQLAHCASATRPGAFEYRPRGHPLQAVWPCSLMCVPCSHSIQLALPIAASKVPIAQAVGIMLPIEQKWPGGHCKHSPAEVRLVALEYVPDAQG